MTTVYGLPSVLGSVPGVRGSPASMGLVRALLEERDGTAMLNTTPLDPSFRR
jgi:hypothetical protein